MIDLLEALATCLCGQISADRSPDTCFCGVIPGEAAVGAYAGNCTNKCGMAWVRLMSMYPSAGLGVPDTTPAGNCAGGLDAIVEVGIMRCVVTMDEQGNPPTAAQQFAATEQQVKDSLTIRRAIACCPVLSPKDFILLNYQPTGPLGGLVGGAWQITVAVN